MGYTEMNMATKKAKEDVLVETVKETKKEIIKVKKVLPKKDSEKKVSTKKVVKEKDSTEEIQAGHESGVTVEQLFEAGAHFGHVAKKWNPKMKEYIWGEKNGIHIFDLGKTVTLIDKASEVLRKASADGKRIIIVGTKRQAKPLVEEMAKKAGIPYMTQRWLGGLLTNWKQIKQTIDRLNTLKLQREAGQLKKFTKKDFVISVTTGFYTGFIVWRVFEFLEVSVFNKLFLNITISTRLLSFLPVSVLLEAIGLLSA